jgi:hypothetical protein
MTILTVATTNTFNEFRITTNEVIGEVNKLTDGTANLVIDTITANTFVGVVTDLDIVGDTGNDVITLGTDTLSFAGGNGISSIVTSNTIQYDLETSGVVSGVYADANTVPQISVDSYGRVTSVANVSIAISSGAVSGLATSATTDTTNANNITSGTLDAARLATSGVSSGTYGSSSNVTQIVVDDKGRVTSASNTAISISSSAVSGLANSATVDTTNASNITAGTLDATRLATSGVTANTYGSSSKIPIITVDQYGRITSASNTDVAGVSNFQYFAANSNFVINTADGNSYAAGIGQDLGTSANVTFQDLTVTGNVAFTGNTILVTANNLIVEDNIIQLAKDNTTDIVDIGILGHYNDGANVHTGFFRDATDSIWKLFQNYPIEPGANTNIDTSNADFEFASFKAHNITANGVFYGNGSGLSSLDASNVSSGTLSSSRLPTSGVSSGTYGSASAVPQIVVDQYGRATSVANVSIAIASGAVSGLATSATTDTTNASNITSGTLLNTRTTANTANSASTIVARDDAGNFSANTITVTDLNSTSDRTLKKNVKVIVEPLSIINSLNGVTFDWIDSGSSYGFIAQDFETVLPHAVHTDERGIKSINYSTVIPFLVESIKVLEERIRALEEQK